MITRKIYFDTFYTKKIPTGKMSLTGKYIRAGSVYELIDVEIELKTNHDRHINVLKYDLQLQNYSN